MHFSVVQAIALINRIPINAKKWATKNISSILMGLSDIIQLGFVSAISKQQFQNQIALKVFCKSAIIMNSAGISITNWMTHLFLRYINENYETIVWILFKANY